MFLHIAQLVHENNLQFLHVLWAALGFLGLTSVTAVTATLTHALTIYLKTLPMWIVLAAIMSVREVHSNHTAKIASSANNVFKKSQ